MNADATDDVSPRPQNEDVSQRQVGPYAVIRRIGQGGMGAVHLARDRSGRLVALKIMRNELVEQEGFERRFQREVEATRRVARFCTAPVLDAGMHDGVAYLVTEFIDGPDLSRAVAERGPLTGSALEGLAVGTAAALTAIHRAGVVHRDLTPSNVLLGPLGPRVIDFGIAQLADMLAPASRPVIGTPSFMAPEQARGETVGPAADVFAWGGLIVFAGTGRLPFGGGSAPDVLYRVVHEGPALDGLDEGLRHLAERALAKDPARRPTAQQLLDELVGKPATSAESAEDTVTRAWSSAPGRTEQAPVERPPAAQTPAAQTPAAQIPVARIPAAGDLADVDLADGDLAEPSPAAPDPAPASPSGGAGEASRPVPGVRLRHRRPLALLSCAAAVLVVLAGGAVWLTGRGDSSFRDDFQDAKSGWVTATTTAGESGYAEGRYRLRVNPGWDLWKSAPVRAEGLNAVHLRTTTADATAGADYGPWCGGHPAGTSGSRYEFHVTTGGQVAITKERASVAPVALFPYARSAVAPGAQAVVEAECREVSGGMELRMWVNGALTAQVVDRDDPYSAGDVGLHAAAGPVSGTAVNVRFDSFEVREAGSAG